MHSKKIQFRGKGAGIFEGVTMNHGRKQNPLIRVFKKFFYSLFVAVTFTFYALESRGTNALTSVSNASITAPPPSSATIAQGEPSTNAAAAPPTDIPAATAAGAAAPPPATSQPPALTNASGYQDGTYTGTEINIRWGYVKVQTTIQGGQITNVQVVEYPTERRTSARINSIAVPDLQQEAMQAQSANVNIITGATLTSEGFQISLQAALTQAKG
jgi:uncharacterized protein with FMN-binding domain